MRLWKVKAGMRPGRGPELGESLFVRSQAAMGREMNTKSLTGHPMFLKPARPKAGRGEILQTTYFYNLPSSFPSFLLFRWRGPVGLATVRGWGWHLCPKGKMDVGSRERISFPSTGERRGVSPSAPQTAFLPGASERGRLLSEGKSSDQWTDTTEFVQTTP